MKKTRVAHLAVACMIAAVAIVGLAGPASAAEAIAAPFNLDYSITDLGGPPGVPGPLGGIVVKQGDPNTLLVGGSANTSSAAIYAVGVTRNAQGHISGYTGTSTLVSTAPNIDGGLAYAPNGTLLYTAFPTNAMGEIKPGSTTPDKIVDLTAAGIVSSVGTLQFVPAGSPGAGKFKIASYNGGQFYDVTLTADAGGTYSIADTSQTAAPGGGPEGIAYVPPASPDFTNPALLISQYSLGKIVAMDTDANGDPDPSTSRDFITGLTGAEGAVIDGSTNDFLFSTFGGGNRILVVGGFGSSTCEGAPVTAGVGSSFDSGTGVTTITGTPGNDVINGGEGNDILRGQTGDDTVNGDSGKDTLYGNIGNDTLDGGADNDKLFGGQNTDSCNGNTGTDKATECETISNVP